MSLVATLRQVQAQGPWGQAWACTDPHDWRLADDMVAQLMLNVDMLTEDGMLDCHTATEINECFSFKLVSHTDTFAEAVLQRKPKISFVGCTIYCLM